MKLLLVLALVAFVSADVKHLFDSSDNLKADGYVYPTPKVPFGTTRKPTTPKATVRSNDPVTKKPKGYDYPKPEIVFPPVVKPPTPVVTKSPLVPKPVTKAPTPKPKPVTKAPTPKPKPVTKAPAPKPKPVTKAPAPKTPAPEYLPPKEGYVYPNNPQPPFIF
uniref:Uncharacterized protein n=1 Tax=Musca domestica TaxID=7370 RepID=A0A1I8NF87_MUSDO